MDNLENIISYLSILVSLCLAIYMYKYYYIKEEYGGKKWR